MRRTRLPAATTAFVVRRSKLRRGMIDWNNVDKRLKVATAFVLTDEERKEVCEREQASFEANLPKIRAAS